MTTDAVSGTTVDSGPSTLGDATASRGGPAGPDVRPLGEVAARLRLVVGRLGRWTRQHGPGTLTAGQHSALATIAGQGPLRLTALAALEGVSPPTATRVVDGLAARGLVVREPDRNDARCHLVALSPVGEDLLREMGTSREALLARQLAHLSQEEIDALEQALPVLEKIVRIPVIPGRPGDVDRLPSMP